MKLYFQGGHRSINNLDFLSAQFFLLSDILSPSLLGRSKGIALGETFYKYKTIVLNKVFSSLEIIQPFTWILIFILIWMHWIRFISSLSFSLLDLLPFHEEPRNNTSSLDYLMMFYDLHRASLEPRQSGPWPRVSENRVKNKNYNKY